jgi:hypothetical protein
MRQDASDDSTGARSARRIESSKPALLASARSETTRGHRSPSLRLLPGRRSGDHGRHCRSEPIAAARRGTGCGSVQGPGMVRMPAVRCAHSPKLGSGAQTRTRGSRTSSLTSTSCSSSLVSTRPCPAARRSRYRSWPCRKSPQSSCPVGAAYRACRCWGATRGPPWGPLVAALRGARQLVETTTCLTSAM